MVYRPPTRGSAVEVPWATLVRAADPNFDRFNHRTPVYEMSNGRTFYEDPSVSGPYNRSADDNVPTSYLLMSDGSRIALSTGGDLWQSGSDPS